MKAEIIVISVSCLVNAFFGWLFFFKADCIYVIWVDLKIKCLLFEFLGVS